MLKEWTTHDEYERFVLDAIRALDASSLRTRIHKRGYVL